MKTKKFQDRNYLIFWFFMFSLSIIMMIILINLIDGTQEKIKLLFQYFTFLGTLSLGILTFIMKDHLDNIPKNKKR
jgi:hypothetical protein